MNKLAICFCLAILSYTATVAQVPNVSKETVSAANPGKLLTQLTNAIKPASFTDAWSGEKGGFLSKAQKISDAASIASTVSTLAGFIKPNMFKEGINAQSILQTANTVKTITDAGRLLKTFEGGLKPEAFLTSWTGQRGGWLNALALLK